ncbi:DUF2922 domain-containing protein [Schinkia azotoformans]|uniref:DUF2922 domain-containing protein n=1 Tax=Schinkia azotoformans TaxID=1454 RepID=UPI002DBE4EFA|nr:DUF2922 domain-containing protein [Schinkia azotoformans]MEC1741779.1 DUF2922 domain-containing protein [Schinkia azotoformans]MEC1746058.1 DUF2922 domain-containing protein [Schinkia azotoformans]MEC1766997.1 DUF2922 domain-containing protein [Schinkia azotoformans]MEC1781792.1 DUF2922 domain-containing protein [Schinkia azotoformans]MEC1787412.1 DUF2922 domain-containing protein [Schinkia azotoformans]
MSKKLELQFTNFEGKTATISIDDPIEPVEAAAVSAAMDAIIAANIFTSTGGDLVAKKGARVVERNVTEVDLGL